jgi:hypothetical protein
MRKSTKLPHRKRNKSARHRSKLKRKLQRRRLKQSSGERKSYR